MVALKTLTFTIVVGGTVLFIVPWLLLRSEGTSMIPSLSIWLIGLVPFLLGAALYFWCAGAFTFIGKGTPAPFDAPIFLVREGPYRRVRNPMYISVLSMLLGEVILFHSLSLLVMLLVAITVVHLFVIFYEEPHLTRQFGESYKEYLRTVPRWLLRFW